MKQQWIVKSILCACLLAAPLPLLASERADTAWQWIVQGAIVVDVRTPQEFEQQHLDGARNYPLSDVATAFNHLDKNTPIVLYCRSGNRSAKAYDYLRQAGFTQLHNGGGLEEMLAVKP